MPAAIAPLRGGARALSEQDAARLRLSRRAAEGRPQRRGRHVLRAAARPFHARRTAAPDSRRAPMRRWTSRCSQHRHQAEYYAWQGNLKGAIDQFELASKAGDGNFYELPTSTRGCATLRRKSPTSSKAGFGRSELIPLPVPGIRDCPDLAGASPATASRRFGSVTTSRHGEPRAAAIAVPGGKPMKILVVDDHPLIQQALALTPPADPRRGRGAAPRSTAPQTLTALARHPDCTLVLLDLALPGAHGLDLLAELRRDYPRLPIVVLSATHDRATVGAALAAGARGYVAKTASAGGAARRDPHGARRRTRRHLRPGAPRPQFPAFPGAGARPHAAAGRRAAAAVQGQAQQADLPRPAAVRRARSRSTSARSCARSTSTRARRRSSSSRARGVDVDALAARTDARRRVAAVAMSPCAPPGAARARPRRPGGDALRARPPDVAVDGPGRADLVRGHVAARSSPPPMLAWSR